MSEQEGDRVDVSVIIPTYNRKESLLRTLDSLSRATYPAYRFEVTAVDDGGDDGTEEIVSRSYPFRLHYLRQDNCGATAARNHGAERSQGQYLIFIDDDIEPAANVIETLASELAARQQTIVLGTLRLPPQILHVSRFARSEYRQVPAPAAGEQVSFQACMTGLLAVDRQDFVNLGGFRDPTGGWPNWDDVDFGYRASRAGFRFWRSAAAVAWHWDYAVADLHTACERWYRASKAAPRLFRTHPGLQGQIPMFRDKGPIAWRQDPPMLILRKLARQTVSSLPAMWSMEHAVPTLERRAPGSKPLGLLYRWIISGYIYRGYRKGLDEQSTQSTATSPTV